MGRGDGLGRGSIFYCFAKVGMVWSGWQQCGMESRKFKQETIDFCNAVFSNEPIGFTGHTTGVCIVMPPALSKVCKRPSKGLPKVFKGLLKVFKSLPNGLSKVFKGLLKAFQRSLKAFQRSLKAF